MDNSLGSKSLGNLKQLADSVLCRLPLSTPVGKFNQVIIYSLPLLFVVVSYNLITTNDLRKKKKKALKRRHRAFKRMPEGDLESQQYIEHSQRFNSITIDGIFINPFPEYKEIPLFELLFMKAVSISLAFFPKDRTELERNLPLVKPNFKLLFGRVPVEEKKLLPTSHYATESRESLFWEYNPIILREGLEVIDESENLPQDQRFTFTWLGQSTCFVQLGDLCILSDPNFSDKLFPLIGPKRLRPLPCDLTDLKVDIVLISHNHVDHLDVHSVKTLGNSVVWYVPLGLRDWFARQGIFRVVELDWWAEHIHQMDPKITITFTPTQHWSGRSLFDVNKSLWGGFVVRKENGPAYFHCGETGYCQVFKEIGRRLGPIRLATIPIGSYHPRWLYQYHHVSPDEAVAIHKDIQAQTSFGINWGTFQGAEEHCLEPHLRLNEVRRDLDFSTSRLGETRCIPFDSSQKVVHICETEDDHHESLNTPMGSSGIFVSEQESELDDGETGSEGFIDVV